MSKGQVTDVTSVSLDAPSVNTTRRRRGHKAAKPQAKRPVGGRGGLRGIRRRIREAREIAQSAAAATAEISVAVLPYPDLVRSAGGRDVARVLVNHLRHAATPYERLLREYPRAHGVLKRRTLDAIADAYPYLREECDRQAEEIRSAT